MTTPNILTFDCETSPNLAHVWSLWNQNVSINQLQESGEVISFAAKWYGKRKVTFRSVHHDGKRKMLESMYEFFEQADWVITYNGNRFDVPHMNAEFLDIGLSPYSPFKNIDLLQTVKKVFQFPSNKLDYVAQRLGLGKKVDHEGHELWVKCMAGDSAAWARMKRYNIHDVRLTEALYNAILPWTDRHPNFGLYVDETEAVCPKCGSQHLQKRGFAYTGVSKFRRYQCQDCHGWSRGRSNTMTKEQRQSILSEVK